MGKVGRASLAGLAAVGLALTGLATTGPANAAVASGEPGADRASAVRSLDAADSEQRDARAYWTPERMRNAEPMDRDVSADAAEGTSQAPTVGTPREVAPSAPDAEVEPQAIPELGAPWEGGGAVTESVGRVFFTHGGQNSACSASVVTSENKSTIITAGHCVYLEGAWHENWVFVPGYDNGAAPYGEWPAEELLAYSAWVDSEDMNFDIGAAVVGSLDGELIEDVVGSQGVAFNRDRGFDAYSFGYPAQGAYDGETLTYSSSATFDDTFGGSESIGIDSDMTGGCSGGPWFADFDESAGAGVVNSVNSFGYTFQPNVLYGPYFGAEAEEVYNQAQAG